jgi:hypothetical protein
MAVRFSAILEGLRAALRREQLPPPSPPVPQAEARPGLLALVFTREQLPPPPPLARPEPVDGDRPGLLQVIFAPEVLPLDPPVVPSTRPGFFTILFAREPLGHQAPAPARDGSRWLAWLLGPEHLDDR